MTELVPFWQSVLDDVKEGGLFEKPKVDYYEFRDKWLPLFNFNSDQSLAPLGEWIQAKCDGNAFIPVDVYKGGEVIPHGYLEGQTTVRGGELMFTVPPILNNNISVKLKDGKGIDGATIQSQELSKRLAVAGTNFFKKNITDNLVFEVDDPERLSKAMDEIFQHFGVVRRKQLVEDSTKTPNNLDDNPELRTSNDDLQFNF